MRTRKPPTFDPTKESLTQFAMRLFDTSEPPLSYYRAALLAGIRPVTLYKALRLRERQEGARCPHCGQTPVPTRGPRGRRSRPPSPQSTPRPRA